MPDNLPFASGDAAQFELPASVDAYLGDPVMVEEVVRNYLGDLIRDRLAYLAGAMPPEDVAKGLTERTDKLAALFMGKGDGFTFMPNWNKATGIGKYLHAKRHFGESQDDSVASLLLYAASRITDAMVDHEAEPDDEDAKFRVDSTVEDTVADLLGMPVDAEARNPPEDGGLDPAAGA